MIRRVVIDFPYHDPDPKVRRENVRYGWACVADSISRGEAPFASHLLYAPLADDLLEQRERVLASHVEWSDVADALAVYVDRGITAGMVRAIEHARARGGAEQGPPWLDYRYLGRQWYRCETAEQRAAWRALGSEAALPT